MKVPLTGSPFSPKGSRRLKESGPRKLEVKQISKKYLPPLLPYPGNRSASNPLGSGRWRERDGGNSGFVDGRRSDASLYLCSNYEHLVFDILRDSMNCIYSFFTSPGANLSSTSFNNWRFFRSSIQQAKYLLYYSSWCKNDWIVITVLIIKRFLTNYDFSFLYVSWLREWKYENNIKKFIINL